MHVYLDKLVNRKIRRSHLYLDPHTLLNITTKIDMDDNDGIYVSTGTFQKVMDLLETAEEEQDMRGRGSRPGKLPNLNH